MTQEQPKLFEVADHSNLGKNFERELKGTHDWYRLQGLADIVKNPTEWIYIGEKEYAELLEKIAKRIVSSGLVAVTVDGRKMKCVPSDVDYSGGGRGLGAQSLNQSSNHFSICFDAKETRGDRLPFQNLKPHQIHRLRQSARCGTIAGFLVKFSYHSRVFFAPVAFVEKKYELWQKSKIGKKRAVAGTAFISITDLEQNAVEIFRHKNNGLWDWLPALVK